MKLFTTFAVALLSALPVLAADCYSDQVDGSVALYQSIASYVCSGAKCGTSSNPCSAASASKKGFITGYATGNSKNHCVEAFNNIIAQCVQGHGQGGGSWNWVKDGITEHYQFQTVI